LQKDRETANPPPNPSILLPQRLQCFWRRADHLLFGDEWKM